MEPLHRDCDATRTRRVHAGDAPPRHEHRAAGTTGCAPRGATGVPSMSGCGAERAKWTDVWCGSAQAPHRRLSPRVVAGLNRSPSRSRIPASPPRRARAPVMTGEAPSARAASVSLRSRTGRRARGRAVPTPVSVDRTRGNDVGTGPAAIPRGTTEGMKRCPDSSTACN
jgi:hypothetical protein